MKVGVTALVKAGGGPVEKEKSGVKENVGRIDGAGMNAGVMGGRKVEVTVEAEVGVIRFLRDPP